MTSKLRWRPLLQGDSAKRALALAERLGAQEGREPFSLLLDGYLFETTARPAALERLGRGLENAFAHVDDLRGHGLYGGLAGLGWSVQHLLSLLGERLPLDVTEALEQIDGAVQSAIEKHSAHGAYEWVSGLAGLALYAQERGVQGPAATMRAAIVRALLADAETSADGLRWLTPPSQLPLKERQMAPLGYYNLGCAHGMPALAYVFAHEAAAGNESAKAGWQGVTRWLLAQQGEHGEGARFTGWLPLGPGTEHPTREAWCYGGLGLSVALLAGALRIGDATLREAALKFARLEAARPLQPTDTCLCHGSAGNGHLFNRLFQATGEAAFRDAALARLNFTLAQWEKDSAPSTDTTFLLGSGGVALALLAACSELEPLWDRLLLADVPVQ